jgi:hypothetical protein
MRAGLSQHRMTWNTLWRKATIHEELAMDWVVPKIFLPGELPLKIHESKKGNGDDVAVETVVIY